MLTRCTRRWHANRFRTGWKLGALLVTLLTLLGIEILVPTGLHAAGAIALLATVAVLSALCAGLDAGLASVCISLFYGLHALNETKPLRLFDRGDKTHFVELLLSGVVAMLVLDLLQRRRLARQQEQIAQTVAQAARIREERFRIAQDLSLDAFMILQAVRDPTGTIVDFASEYANATAARWLRCTPEELPGRRLLQFIPDGPSRLALFQRFARVVQTGLPYDIEVNSDTPSIGGWHREVAVLLGDGLAVYVSDITQRRQAEQALRESHQKVTAVLESITDGFYALDRNWRFTYINAQAERYLGCSREALLGRNIWESRPGLIGSAIDQQFRKAVAEGTAIIFESTPPVSQGWLEVHVYPSSAGLSVYFRDITDRKRAEDALRENEAMLARAQQIANVGSWEYQLGHGQILCSDQAYRILGLTPIQLQAGQDAVLARVHPDDQPHLVRAMRRTFTDGASCRVELRILGPDGSVRTVLAQAERINDKAGRPVRLAGTVLDISERKQVEQQLGALNETLERRGRRTDRRSRAAYRPVADHGQRTDPRRAA